MIAVVLACLVPAAHGQLHETPVAGDDDFMAMRYAKASTAYDSLLRVTADSSAVLWRLARLHICIGDTAQGDVSRDEYREAGQYASRAMLLDSSSSIIRTWYAAALGSVAMHEGGKTKVRLAWEIKRQIDSAIALDPDNDIAFSILGSFHRSLSDLSWFERSLASLFVGSLPEGSYEEGEKALKRAIQINPRAPRHQYELGLLYLDWGKEDLARHALERSAALPFITARDVQNRRDALRRLEEMRQ